MEREEYDEGLNEEVGFSEDIIREIITEMEDEKLIDEDVAHQIRKISDVIAVIFERYMS